MALVSSPLHQFSRRRWLLPAVACWALALLVVLAGLFPAALGPLAALCLGLWLLRGVHNRLVFILMALGFGISAAGGLISFTFVPQVRGFAESGVDPLDLIAELHIWAPRYAAAYPAVLLSNGWNLGLDEAFTYYGAVLLTIEALVLTEVWAEVAQTMPAWREWHKLLAGLGIAMAVFVIATQMNGRLVPAHLGMALLLLAEVRATKRGFCGKSFWLLVALALPMTLMSTGTVVPAAILAVVWTAIIVRRSGRISVVPLLVGAPLVGWLLVYLVAGTVKNLDFYGGGLEAAPDMLEHGFGRFFWLEPLFIVTIIAGFVVLCFIYAGMVRYLHRLEGSQPLLFAIPVAAACGLFGYSTLTMGLPPAEVLLGLLCYRFALDRYRLASLRVAAD